MPHTPQAAVTKQLRGQQKHSDGASKAPKPRRSALHPPVASARVGRGVTAIVSMTRVISTGLPTRLHVCVALSRAVD
jgi:hypothetical protein